MRRRIRNPLGAACAACLLAPLLFLSLCAGAAAQSDDLQRIYTLAMARDADIEEARANYRASHTRLAQGRSYLLPSLSATATTARDTSGVAQVQPGRALPEHSFASGYNAQSYGVELQQAVVDLQAWHSLKSVSKSDAAAALTLVQAEQHLIIRVAQAYFDVLRSQANLASFGAEEDAARQVLFQTQQRFDAGLVAITDVYDSQANADLASVNRLIEENLLNQRLEALAAITGQPHAQLALLREDFPIATVSDGGLQDWELRAQESNLGVRIAQLHVDAGVQDTRAARAALLPTLALGASYRWNRSPNPVSLFPAVATEQSSIELKLTVPLFAGGRNRARLQEVVHVLDAREAALLRAQRDSARSIRNAWRSVETDVRAVAARLQAINSAQSALEATELGTQVGTRNIVDVVLAQRVLYQAQRDHANARFTYVIDTLLLKQAAGVLTPQDVQALNAWLR